MNHPDNVYETDERIVVNRGCEGIPMSLFTKEHFLLNLNFTKNISANKDILEFLDKLILKTERISDEEWEEIKKRIPFDIYYDAENNVD